VTVVGSDTSETRSSIVQKKVQLIPVSQGLFTCLKPIIFGLYFFNARPSALGGDLNR
jgi:hypothetical protein